MPDAHPKSSAGKPSDAEAPGEKKASSGLTSAPSSFGPSAPQAKGPGQQQVADVRATVGAPQVTGDARSVDMFALKPGGPKTVPTFVVDTGAAKVVKFTAKMAIDADGAGGWSARDPVGQDKTSLRYPGGESLNPGVIPFIVVPLDFGRSHPDVKLGDYAAVTYGGKTVYAIVGDKGPTGVVGEGSMALAKALGIDPSPTHGGAASGVTYLILPGSRDSAPPRAAAAIQDKGEVLFRKAGIPIG